MVRDSGTADFFGGSPGCLDVDRGFLGAGPISSAADSGLVMSEGG